MIVKDTLEELATAVRGQLDANPGRVWNVHLYTTAFAGALQAEMDVADLLAVEADFDGYAPASVAPPAHSNAFWIPGTGWLWYFDAVAVFTFEPIGGGLVTSNELRGFFLLDSLGAFVGAKDFAAPVVISDTETAKAFKLGMMVFHGPDI